MDDITEIDYLQHKLQIKDISFTSKCMCIIVYILYEMLCFKNDPLK